MKLALRLSTRRPTASWNVEGKVVVSLGSGVSERKLRVEKSGVTLVVSWASR